MCEAHPHLFKGHPFQLGKTSEINPPLLPSVPVQWGDNDGVRLNTACVPPAPDGNLETVSDSDLSTPHPHPRGLHKVSIHEGGLHCIIASRCSPRPHSTRTWP